MKLTRSLFVFIFLFLTPTLAHAATYYFSTATGDDTRTATQAQNSATPWQSITKLNSYFLSLQPGDSVLFNRGETFYGGIVVSKSGTAGSPITIGAYGNGAKPVITGFTTVSGWTNLGSNIWESTGTVSTLSRLNIVVINGVNTPMGRFPNSGFLTYESHTGTTSITDSDGLSGTPNWTGAEVAMFTTNWSIDKNKITAQSGGTLTYTSATGTGIQKDGLRYIIQNDSRTLDQQNEWYYNPLTQKLQIYSTSMPTNVQVPTIDILATNTGTGDTTIKSYIVYDNVAFTGANLAAIQLRVIKNITIQNCDFYTLAGNGIDGPYGYTSLHGVGLTISNNTFTGIGNGAINLTNDYPTAYIGYNTISNIGQVIGATNDGSNQGIGIRANGAGTLTEYNTVSNIGYNGIRFDGSNSIVKNNFISHVLSLYADGGGIYTWAGYNSSRPVFTGRKLLNNIIIDSFNPLTSGIYIDDGSSGVEVAGNIVAGNTLGIYLHGNQNMDVHDNTVYNNTENLLMQSEMNAATGQLEIITNNNLYNNIFVAKDVTQKIMNFTSKTGNDIPGFGLAYNNIYTRPIDETAANLSSLHVAPFEINYLVGSTWTYLKYTLSQWKAFVTPQDANSNAAPNTITDPNNLRFEYNDTNSNKTISLGANYIDMKNVAYNGSITLLPFTAAILILTNLPPIVNAGIDQTITLPTSTVTVTGTASDPESQPMTYSWANVSGPAGSTITTPTALSTTITGLVQGTYTFWLTVSDGVKTNADQIVIVVNAAVDPLSSSIVIPPAGAGGIASVYVAPVISPITPITPVTPLDLTPSASKPSIIIPPVTITIPLSGVRSTSSITDIKNLQLFLNQTVGTQLPVDGIWGLPIINGIRAFQTSLGVKADGSFGSGTALKAIEILNKTIPVGSSTPRTWNIPIAGIKKTNPKTDIFTLQAFLNYTFPTNTPLKVDGKWGQKTTAAITLFQKQNNLKVDGKFGRLSAKKARGE